MKKLLLILVLVSASIYSQAQLVYTGQSRYRGKLPSETVADTARPAHFLITPMTVVFGQPQAGAVSYEYRLWDCTGTSIIHYKFCTYTANTDSSGNVVSHTLTAIPGQEGDITIGNIDPNGVQPGTLTSYAIDAVDDYIDGMTITER